MKTFAFVALLFLLTTAGHADDSRKPRIRITDVDKSKDGGLTILDFTIVAKDNVEVLRIDYRAAVDGKQGRWTKYPYYGGSVSLPFRVDCNIFVLEVRAVDRAKNESKLVKKTFSGLKG